jgi:hypothetical protein
VEQTGRPPPGNATWMRRDPAPARALPAPMIPDSSQSQSLFDEDLQTSEIRPNQPRPPNSIGRVLRNAKFQRIDLPEKLIIPTFTLNAIRDRPKRLCNSYYLVNNCPQKSDCEYDHKSRITYDEYAALLYLSRTQPCPQGSSCNVALCVKGHMCSNGRPCKYGASCRFAHLHSIDTTVVD